MSVLLVVSLGCGDKKDPAPATEGSNPPAAGTGDGAGNPAATQPGPGGADQGVAEGEKIATPEELARRSFEAFTSKDRDLAKNLTMAGLTVEAMTDFIRKFRESGGKGPERDRDKSDAEIGAKEHARMQKGFDDSYRRMQDFFGEQGIDPSQAKFVKFIIGAPTDPEEIARMKEDIPFDFADVTVIFESGGNEYRLHVDDCFKLPGVGWRAAHGPRVRTFSPAGEHSRGETSAASGVNVEPANARETDNATEPDSENGEATTSEAVATNAKIGFEVGNQAPEIIGEDVDGKKFKLSDYRGKVVLLDFWGDW
jgi:transposase InsO family protein